MPLAVRLLQHAPDDSSQEQLGAVVAKLALDPQLRDALMWVAPARGPCPA